MKTLLLRPRPSRTARRRGVALVVLVVALAVASLTVAAAVQAAGSDAQIAAFRVETTRAFFAAESGTAVVARLVADGKTLPTAGHTLSLPSASAVLTALPNPTTGGDLVVEGRSGDSLRRVRVSFAP